MVLRQPIGGKQAAVALSVVGAPLFVAEIVSVSTLDGDQEGKRIAYALARIPEYLLFDPSGTLLPTPVVAWRLPSPAARVYQPWLPEPDGSWRSQALDVWFVPDPPFLRIRGNDGRLLDPPLDTARRARRWEAQWQREAAERAEAERQRAQADAARTEAEARIRQAEEALRQQQLQMEEALRQERSQMEADRAELARLRALLERQNE
jgi:hypothetical protein